MVHGQANLEYVLAGSCADKYAHHVCLQGFSFQDDDVDDHLNKQYTEQFNFGGGLLEKKVGSSDPDADPDKYRSKKEVHHTSIQLLSV